MKTIVALFLISSLAFADEAVLTPIAAPTVAAPVPVPALPADAPTATECDKAGAPADLPGVSYCIRHAGDPAPIPGRLTSFARHEALTRAAAFDNGYIKAEAGDVAISKAKMVAIILGSVALGAAAATTVTLIAVKAQQK